MTRDASLDSALELLERARTELLDIQNNRARIGSLHDARMMLRAADRVLLQHDEDARPAAATTAANE